MGTGAKKLKRVGKVLLGEDGGGNKNGDLVSCANHGGGSEKGNDGFPASDIALDETVSGAVIFEIF